MNRDILKYLPEYTTIAESPDLYYGSIHDTSNDIKIKTTTLKTKDIVNSFLGLQRQALNRIDEINSVTDRDILVMKIKRMSYF